MKKGKMSPIKKFTLTIIITISVLVILGIIGYMLPEEPVETITVEEAIENGSYELTDKDLEFRRKIDDILKELNLKEMNAFSFQRVPNWKDGKRYSFEIKEDSDYEWLTAYTKNGRIVSIKSKYGYIYNVEN